jgi:fumarate hydratase class I
VPHPRSPTVHAGSISAGSACSAEAAPASFLAPTVQPVLGVCQLDEFGVPEAIWVIEVKNFPVGVNMDAHDASQHKTIDEQSQQVLDELLRQP